MNKNFMNKLISDQLKIFAYRDFMKRRIENIAAETESVRAKMVSEGWKNDKITLATAKRTAVECDPLSIDSEIWAAGWDAAFEIFEKYQEGA